LNKVGQSQASTKSEWVSYLLNANQSWWILVTGRGGKLKSLVPVISSILFASCLRQTVDLNTITGPPISDTSGVSFANQVQPIFTANCAMSGCHAGTLPQDGMSLEDGKAYANIVNQHNIDFGNYLIVKPFYSDSSFLYFKITGNSIAGPRMPFEKPPLPDSSIELIKQWIDQGAKAD